MFAPFHLPDLLNMPYDEEKATMNPNKEQFAGLSLTIKVDLLAFNSMADCIDVFPLRLLSPSLGASFKLGGLSFGTGFGIGVAKEIIKINTIFHNKDQTTKQCQKVKGNDLHQM